MKFYRVKTSNPKFPDRYFSTLEIAVSFFIMMHGGYAVEGIDAHLEEFELINNGEYKMRYCPLEFNASKFVIIVRSTQVAKLLRRATIVFEFDEDINLWWRR